MSRLLGSLSRAARAGRLRSDRVLVKIRGRAPVLVGTGFFKVALGVINDA
jgi:hypothetical protein